MEETMGIYTTFAVGAALLTAVTGFSASTAQAQVTPPCVLYDVVYARSVNQPTEETAGRTVETVVTIKNPNTFDMRVRVQWLDPTGTVIGNSTLTVKPDHTREFTTANRGEIVVPFILDALRNTTVDFEGGARVLSLNQDCKADHRLSITAAIVFDTRTVFEIQSAVPSHWDVAVVRPQGTVGD
jgi:hypothetical protein